MTEVQHKTEVATDLCHCAAEFYLIGPCPGPAVALVTSGCVHEHVTARPICRGCLNDWLAGMPPDCASCDEGEQSHSCPKILITVVPA